MFGGYAYLVRILLVSSALLTLVNVSRAHTCSSGADVSDKSYCRFFFRYVDRHASSPDPRIVERFPPSDAESLPIRQFALIVDVNNYPNMDQSSDRTLASSKVDLEKLEALLIDQGFDEIIVLENDDASKKNIDYILGNYLLRQISLYSRRSRLLFAYSGHGAAGPTGFPGSLGLSHYSGPYDTEDLYPLSDLAPKLRVLASETYQFVALLGSCFSGGIFLQTQGASGGDNDVFPGARGAHAITAVRSDELAYAFGKGRGTLFFDHLIDGIVSGDGDRDYSGWVELPDHTLKQVGGGIVRLGALNAYVSAKIGQDPLNPITKKPFPQVRMGSLEVGDDWGGAFFFLGPKGTFGVNDQLAKNDPASCGGSDHSEDCSSAVSLSINKSEQTGSSFRQNPQINLFQPPDTYGIRGFDASHYNGPINWTEMKKSSIKFAYIKGTEGGKFVDPRFLSNWRSARQSGIMRGAYHVFNFCIGVDEQFDRIIKTIPKDPTALPIALDLEWYGAPTPRGEEKCNDRDALRSKIVSLLTRLRYHYGKAPIIHASASGVADLSTPEWNQFAIWLQYFKKTPGFTDDPGSLKAYSDVGPSMPAGNPWTIWQVGSEGKVPGVNTSVDVDVFFGNAQEFEAFSKSGTNVAFTATFVRQ